ncbi:Crp/Fnr family transcriptional regulator [Puia sp. P3]|uniref:Crp/Fnr family transcriptional regulator n=1 Tax=Puia sp. P3 TaxID=3423952 RepID=UPI003D6764FD
MFEQIDNIVGACIQLTEEERRIFHSLLRFRRVRKRSLLLQEGDVCSVEAFIIKGCIRRYYINEDGSETNLSFAVEGWWVSDPQSFGEQSPSDMFIEALEESELLLLDYRSKNELLERVPKFERFFRLLLQRNLAHLQGRWRASVAHTAEQRYTSFIDKYPNIAARVTQTQIAKYIGVSPEFLSKMRSSMYRRAV